MFQKDHAFTQVNGRSKNEILQYISKKAEDLHITKDQVGLTFSLSFFANTGFLSFFQNNVPTYIMKRFSGVVGVVESVIVIVLTFSIG